MLDKWVLARSNDASWIMRDVFSQAGDASRHNLGLLAVTRKRDRAENEDEEVRAFRTRGDVESLTGGDLTHSGSSCRESRVKFFLLFYSGNQGFGSSRRITRMTKQALVANWIAGTVRVFPFRAVGMRIVSQAPLVHAAEFIPYFTQNFVVGFGKRKQVPRTRSSLISAQGQVMAGTVGNPRIPTPFARLYSPTRERVSHGKHWTVRHGDQAIAGQRFTITLQGKPLRQVEKRHQLIDGHRSARSMKQVGGSFRGSAFVIHGSMVPRPSTFRNSPYEARS